MFACTLHAQTSPGGVTQSKAWLKSDASELNANQRSSEKFNFHPPCIVNSGFFGKDFTSKNISVFMVDFTKTDEQIILSGNHDADKIQFNASEVVNRKSLPFEATENAAKILFYKDRWNRSTSFNEEIFLETPGEKQIAEMIVFGKAINREQQEKIESYLSIKYGISLTENFQYVSSNGSKIFKLKRENNYKHRVTALGRDDNSALYQKQSMNSNGDVYFVLTLDKLKEYNRDNTGTILDQSFIFWSDDNGAMDVVERSSSDATIERSWRVDLNAMQEESKEVFLYMSLPEKLLGQVRENWYVSISADADGLSDDSQDVPVQISEKGKIQAKITFDTSKGTEQFIHIRNSDYKVSEAPLVELYPNPVSVDSKCKIRLLNLPQGDVQITIRDITGKRLSTQSFFAKSKAEELDLEFSNVGMHTVEIEYAETRLTKTIIVLD